MRCSGKFCDLSVGIVWLALLAALVLPGCGESSSTSDLKSKRHVDELVEMLKDEDAAVRLSAAHLLGEIGPAAAPALVTALQDDDASVRRNAAVALGSIGPAAKEALPALTTALKDEDRRVREAARSALKKIKAGP